MWHELTHQRERGEETEYDREDHANIIGYRESYSNLTNEVSIESAGEKVDIIVGGKFINQGGIVANVNEEGKDLGNLEIKAKEYEYSNLENIDYIKDQNLSISVNIGKGEKEEENNKHPNGSFTLGHKDIESESTSKNLATIGSGSVQVEQEDGSYKEIFSWDNFVNNLIEEGRYEDIYQDMEDEIYVGINRDINNIKVESQTYKKHNIDSDITVDLRFFSPEGREEIEDQIIEDPLSPAWSYYYMEKHFKYAPDLAINTRCSDGVQWCTNGYTMGTPVTGLDTSSIDKLLEQEKRGKDPLWKNIVNNIPVVHGGVDIFLSFFNTTRGRILVAYDDSRVMRGLNYLPGFQTWSKSHDYYLSEENKYRPFGDNTVLTILPFAIMGTYGGIYGTLLTTKENIKGLFNGNK